MTRRVRRPVRIVLAAAVLAVAGAAAGSVGANETVPCNEDSLATLKQMIRDSRAKISEETRTKAERQYDLARKAHAEGKGRLCSLALKKGMSVLLKGVR